MRIQNDNFGAEHHKVCGFDKLFVMDGDDNRNWSLYIKKVVKPITYAPELIGRNDWNCTLKTYKDMVACAHQKIVLVSTMVCQQWIHTMVKKSATLFGTNDQFCLVQIIWSLLSILVRSFLNQIKTYFINSQENFLVLWNQ